MSNIATVINGSTGKLNINIIGWQPSTTDQLLLTGAIGAFVLIIVAVFAMYRYRKASQFSPGEQTTATHEQLNQKYTDLSTTSGQLKKQHADYTESIRHLNEEKVWMEARIIEVERELKTQERKLSGANKALNALGKVYKLVLDIDESIEPQGQKTDTEIPVESTVGKAIRTKSSETISDQPPLNEKVTEQISKPDDIQVSSPEASGSPTVSPQGAQNIQNIQDEPKQDEPRKLTPTMLQVVDYLKEHPHVLHKDIAAALNVHKGNLSKTLKSLVDMGVVKHEDETGYSLPDAYAA